MTIKWTPWNASMDRRLEVFWAFYVIFVAIICGPLCVILMLYLLVMFEQLLLDMEIFIKKDKSVSNFMDNGSGLDVFFQNLFALDMQHSFTMIDILAKQAVEVPGKDLKMNIMQCKN